MEFSTGSAIRGVNNYIYDGLVNKRIINQWNVSISSDHSFLLQINYENLMISPLSEDRYNISGTILGVSRVTGLHEKDSTIARVSSSE